MTLLALHQIRQTFAGCYRSIGAGFQVHYDEIGNSHYYPTPRSQIKIRRTTVVDFVGWIQAKDLSIGVLRTDNVETCLYCVIKFDSCAIKSGK